MAGATQTRLLVALAVLLPLSGCFTPFWEQEGPDLTTFALYAEPRSGRLGETGSFGPNERLEFDGCFLVDVDDTQNRGRVVADGYLDPLSRVVARMEEFRGPNESRGGGVGIDRPDVGKLPDGTQVLPEVPTVVAGWGNTSLELNGVYLDDIFSGEYNFTAHFLVTEHGFQDDETGAILAQDGSPFSPERPDDVRTAEGDWEAHLLVHSHDTGEFQQTIVYRNRDDGGGMIVSDESYFQENFFVVSWLGGEARFRIQVNGTTLIEAAQTSLTFRFFDPGGVELANTTIAPSGSGGASATEEIVFPTPRIGTYSFTVEGPAHAASYEIFGTLVAADSYRMHFSWEELGTEPNPFKAFDKCAVSKDRGQPVSGNANIAKPPGLNVIVVALGVLGTIVASLMVVKLVVDSRKIDEFRSKFGKK